MQWLRPLPGRKTVCSAAQQRAPRRTKGPPHARTCCQPRGAREARCGAVAQGSRVRREQGFLRCRRLGASHRTGLTHLAARHRKPRTSGGCHSSAHAHTHTYACTRRGSTFDHPCGSRASVRPDRRPLSKPSLRHSLHRSATCCGRLQLIVEATLPVATAARRRLGSCTHSAPLCVLAARAAQRSCSSGHWQCGPGCPPVLPGARLVKVPHAIDGVCRADLHGRARVLPPRCFSPSPAPPGRRGRRRAQPPAAPAPPPVTALFRRSSASCIVPMGYLRVLCDNFTIITTIPAGLW